MSGTEKRKNRRVKAKGVAGYVRTKDSASPMPYAVEDISAGGVLLRTDSDVAPGTPVTISLVKPGIKKALDLKGKVVARRPAAGNAPGLSIQFDDPPDEVWLRIEQMMKELGKQGVSGHMKVTRTTVDGVTKVLLQQAGLEPAIDPESAPVDGLAAQLKEAQEKLAQGQARIAALEKKLLEAVDAIQKRDEYIKAIQAQLKR